MFWRLNFVENCWHQQQFYCIFCHLFFFFCRVGKGFFRHLLTCWLLVKCVNFSKSFSFFKALILVSWCVSTRDSIHFKLLCVRTVFDMELLPPNRLLFSLIRLMKYIYKIIHQLLSSLIMPKDTSNHPLSPPTKPPHPPPINYISVSLLIFLTNWDLNLNVDCQTIEQCRSNFIFIKSKIKV